MKCFTSSQTCGFNGQQTDIRETDTPLDCSLRCILQCFWSAHYKWFLFQLRWFPECKFSSCHEFLLMAWVKRKHIYSKSETGSLENWHLFRSFGSWEQTDGYVLTDWKWKPKVCLKENRSQQIHTALDKLRDHFSCCGNQHRFISTVYGGIPTQTHPILLNEVLIRRSLEHSDRLAEGENRSLLNRDDHPILQMSLNNRMVT